SVVPSEPEGVIGGGSADESESWRSTRQALACTESELPTACGGFSSVTATCVTSDPFDRGAFCAAGSCAIRRGVPWETGGAGGRKVGAVAATALGGLSIPPLRDRSAGADMQPADQRPHTALRAASHFRRLVFRMTSILEA